VPGDRERPIVDSDPLLVGPPRGLFRRNALNLGGEVLPSLARDVPALDGFETRGPSERGEGGVENGVSARLEGSREGEEQEPERRQREPPRETVVNSS
jgi:hypothetical protein